MEFLELAKKRFSVRKYQSKKVEDDKLMKILEAGRVAPTGVNAQPQRIIVTRDEKGLKKLKKGARIYGAPLALIVCVDHGATWKRPHDNKDIGDIDVSIVTDHMMLQATELGLGSLWICHFDPVIVNKEFNLPHNVEPINILTLGYNEGEIKYADRHDEVRKSLNELVFYESYGNN